MDTTVSKLGMVSGIRLACLTTHEFSIRLPNLQDELFPISSTLTTILFHRTQVMPDTATSALRTLVRLKVVFGESQWFHRS